MPLPVAAVIIGSANPSLVPYVVTTVGGIGYSIYSYFVGSDKDALPKLTDTAKAMTNDVRADVNALALETSKRVAWDKVLEELGNTRLDELLTRFDGGLVSMEHHTDALEEKALKLSTAHVPQHEVTQDVTDDLKAQLVDIQAVAASLQNLPELLKARRDNQALLVENKQLKATVGALEDKVSELSVCMNQALEFAENVQNENDGLRKQCEQLKTTEPPKQSSRSGFGFSLFSS